MTLHSATGKTRSGGILMKRIGALLTAALLLCLTVGCGSDKEKGQNRDKDKPRAGETAGVNP
jgi:hypothetical protein